MKHARLAWTLGGVATIGLGMAAEACSSSNTTSGNGDGGSTQSSSTRSTTTSSSTSGTGSSGASSSTSTSESSSTSSDDAGSSSGSGSGSGNHCRKPPTLRAPSDAGVECPAGSGLGSGTGSGGGGLVDCTIGQHCCETAMGAGTCTAPGTACGAAGDLDWACDGPSDCVGSAAPEICCGDGTLTTVPACGAYPAYSTVMGFSGTACAASCAGKNVVCVSDSDCPGQAAGSCVAVDPRGTRVTVGYCASDGSGSGSSSGSSSGSGSGT
jgi:hypothetical protein